MVNARLCEKARLISFLQTQDLFSLAKEIETPWRHQRKIQDDKTPEIWLSFSLRIQPPLIPSRYEERNAKRDVCDSWPEIPY